MEGLPFDKRILHIAAEATETSDRDVPKLFLGLKGTNKNLISIQEKIKLSFYTLLNSTEHCSIYCY